MHANVTMHSIHTPHVFTYWIIIYYIHFLLTNFISFSVYNATVIFTLFFTVFFDTILTPDGGDDEIIDVEEGGNLIVSCTGNPHNTVTGTLAKTYQWFDSAGNAVTESTPFPPNNFVRDNISKQDGLSGVYECRYTLTSSGETTSSSVTINVAGMFVCISNNINTCVHMSICGFYNNYNSSPIYVYTDVHLRVFIVRASL